MHSPLGRCDQRPSRIPSSLPRLARLLDGRDATNRRPERLGTPEATALWCWRSAGHELGFDDTYGVAMAYDHALADDIRARLADRRDVTEKEMFGGIAFMVSGNMAVGVTGDELMVRVGKDAHDETVALPGARIFDMSARPMRGWVVVAPEGFITEAELDDWIARGVGFAESLPAK